MKIENVNTGVCHRRVQSGEPCFFVNWVQDGENQYRFFSLRFACEALKIRLIKMSKL